MRRSSFRHPIAVLRKKIDYQQKQFANLIGRSRHYLQAVELKKQKVSGDMALRISAATGVAASYILHEDPTAPIVDLQGRPYTIETFEWHCSKQKRKVDSLAYAEAAKILASNPNHFTQENIEAFETVSIAHSKLDSSAWCQKEGLDLGLQVFSFIQACASRDDVQLQLWRLQTEISRVIEKSGETAPNLIAADDEPTLRWTLREFIDKKCFRALMAKYHATGSYPKSKL